jgi:hypothetical protein
VNFYFTFLGVSCIESLKDEEQKLDFKNICWENSKCSTIYGLNNFFKKIYDLKKSFKTLFLSSIN